jgi:hypothetical protein
MGRKDESGSHSSLRRQARHRFARSVDPTLDKTGMVEIDPQLIDSWSFFADLALRLLDILQILPATGIRAVGRREKGERAVYAAVAHAAQRINQKRMPIPIAPIDGQRDPISLKIAFDRRNQGSVLSIDRTDAAKALVVLRDGEHPLARNVLAAQHVFQKRNYIGRSLGPAKGDEQDRLVIKLCHVATSDPDGIRTRVAGVKGQCPRPLDDGAIPCPVGYIVPPAPIRQVAARKRTYQADYSTEDGIRQQQDPGRCKEQKSTAPPARPHGLGCIATFWSR